MPEQDYNDRPFPMQIRINPPRAIERATQFFRLLLARSAFGVRTLPLISAGEAWARLLAKAGERLDAWYGLDVLEFLRLWSDVQIAAATRPQGEIGKDFGSSQSSERLQRFANLTARRNSLFQPTQPKKALRLDQLAEIVETNQDSALPDTIRAFPRITRLVNRQIVNQDPAPAERTSASASDRRPLMLRQSLQGYQADQHDYGDAWFLPSPLKALMIHPEPANKIPVFPALSTAETLVGRIFGRETYFTGRDHAEAVGGSDALRVKTVFQRHATEALWSTRSEFSQAQPSAYAQGGVDSAPPWSYQAAQSLGRPLGVIPRVILERSFPDLNLSQVRVHTDAPADTAARELGADAFVLGQDLFFRSGTFNPLTEQGLALLTHELVHVRQSGNGPAPSAPSRRDRLEREAREIEGALLRSSAHPRSAPQPHRDFEFAGRHPSRAFSALALDFTRHALLPTAIDRGTGSNVQRTASLPLERFAGSRPLTAEAGRAVSPSPEPSTGSAGAGSAAQDPDVLSRRFFRALEQKIVIEKERRGVDRWAP